jgi:O-antigen/teichoic acid export membrane protein
MIYGVSSWIVPVALGTIATPIIVKSLGPRQYGIYALVLGLIAYSFNFNVGRAVTKYLAEYRSAGETGKIRSVLAATFAVNLVVGTLGLIVTILLAPYLVSRVFQIEESFREEALTAVYLSAFIIFAFIWGQVFNAVLQGLNRIDVYSKVQNLTSFVMVGGRHLHRARRLWLERALVLEPSPRRHSAPFSLRSVRIACCRNSRSQ